MYEATRGPPPSAPTNARQTRDRSLEPARERTASTDIPDGRLLAVETPLEVWPGQQRAEAETGVRRDSVQRVRDRRGHRAAASGAREDRGDVPVLDRVEDRARKVARHAERANDEPVEVPAGDDRARGVRAYRGHRHQVRIGTGLGRDVGVQRPREDGEHAREPRGGARHDVVGRELWNVSLAASA